MLVSIIRQLNGNSTHEQEEDWLIVVQHFCICSLIYKNTEIRNCHETFFCTIGSILAVTSSTIHAPQKTTRFVGICIMREGTGLCSNFLLRNVVDNQGIVSVVFLL
jgi:hypothetical protein